ncbi:MAG: ferrochelatase [Gammaproteobacteria bacterium]
MTRGILLVNLGTPASCTTADVRAYLKQFLNDPYVVDLPSPFRQLVVGAFILPFRPRRSAAAYDKIWDAAGPGTGSPLLHYGRRLAARLVNVLPDMPVELAMRYGKPDIPSALARLAEAGVTEVLLLALYPQHADSTRTTTIESVRAALPTGLSLTVVPPFFDDPDYLAVQASLIARHLPERWDHLLFSYHGLPERHLIKADPTGNHCLQSPDCCEVPSTAHPTCYRHQVRITSTRLATLLGIGDERYSTSFQSRLGRLPWLTPYTDQVLGELPSRGVQHLAVACPSFVADNLETLEEIGMAGKAHFLAAGGSTFTLIPCLNDEPEWVSVIAGWCRDRTATTATAPHTRSARSETAR